MADELARRRLGRGLATLIGDVETPAQADRSRAPRRLSIASLRPNPRNPRKSYDPVELDELVQSVREKGVVQPILVRPVGTEFEIIAGERRWRAAQKAGLHDVPVVVQEATDKEALELAIIENVQRSDLNPARGGGRIPAADRRLPIYPSPARRGNRQEPAAHRQYASPPQILAGGPGLSPLRPDQRRPCPGDRYLARP